MFRYCTSVIGGLSQKHWDVLSEITESSNFAERVIIYKYLSNI